MTSGLFGGSPIVYVSGLHLCQPFEGSALRQLECQMPSSAVPSRSEGPAAMPELSVRLRRFSRHAKSVQQHRVEGIGALCGMLRVLTFRTRPPRPLRGQLTCLSPRKRTAMRAVVGYKAARGMLSNLDSEGVWHSN